MTLRELIEREAESLMAAHRAGRPEWAYLIRGDRYRPGKSPATDAELRAAPLIRAQARGSIVRFHWFEDEAAMLAHADEVVDPAFEAACDAIVEGAAAALRALLARDPALVHARSRFAHHQTLLQHVAANGSSTADSGSRPPMRWRSPRSCSAPGPSPMPAAIRTAAGPPP